MVRLNIGLSQRIFYYKDRAYDSIEHGWYSWLKEHTLFFIPNQRDQDFLKLANELDAFVITGGDDNALRRSVELNLAALMVAQNKPVIGICHGCFLITDTLQGQVGSIEGHMDTKHFVHYCNQVYNVNSYHQLSIIAPPPGAQVLAVDDQGTCEAWILDRVAGIVWHPERMDNPWIPAEIADLLKE